MLWEYAPASPQPTNHPTRLPTNHHSNADSRQQFYLDGEQFKVEESPSPKDLYF